MVGAVSPVGSPSGAGSSLMGLSAGFRLLGHFCGPIPSAWVVYPGHWVVAMGLQAFLWVFSWAVSGNPRVAFARGG